MSLRGEGLLLVIMVIGLVAAFVTGKSGDVLLWVLVIMLQTKITRREAMADA